MISSPHIQARTGLSGAGMRTRRVATVLVTAAALLLSPIPLSHADDTSACILANQTPDQCDQHFLDSLAKAKIDFNPPQAIAAGHIITNRFAGHPNRSEFRVIVTSLMKANPALSPDQAVFEVQAAIKFYGPPGLEDTMNAVMSAPE